MTKHSKTNDLWQQETIEGGGQPELESFLNITKGESL